MFTTHPKIRAIIYVLALASQIAAFFVRIYSPELGEAFTSTADLLAVAAGVTALTNITDPRANGLGGTAPEIK